MEKDKCYACGAETELYFRGQPICEGCDEELTRRQREEERIREQPRDPNVDQQNGEKEALI